jgi:hypothetical protein
LHEIGHALGLADDADPNSIMYYGSGAQNRQLDATDITNITALYPPANKALPKLAGTPSGILWGGTPLSYYATSPLNNTGISPFTMAGHTS